MKEKILTIKEAREVFSGMVKKNKLVRDLHERFYLGKPDNSEDEPLI